MGVERRQSSSYCLADNHHFVLSISPSSLSSPLPPPADREKNLPEQAQRIYNESLLERQPRAADAARRALEEEGGRFTIRLKIPTGEKIT